MKKFIVFLLMLLVVGPSIQSMHVRSDAYPRSKALKIHNGQIECSAVQVKAKSGINYILTAAHCRSATLDGAYRVFTEDGRVMQRKLIAESPNADLLLIEGIPNMEGLEPAPFEAPLEHVRTFTHGGNRDLYKTEGQLVQADTVPIVMSPEECITAFPKYTKKTLETWFVPAEVCFMTAEDWVMTASVIPGSSGGMVVNEVGELIGIVSATDGFFGYIASLDDIKDFLSNY